MRIKRLLFLWLFLLPMLMSWWFYTAKPSLESEFTNEILETLFFVLSTPEDMRVRRQFFDKESKIRYHWNDENHTLTIERQSPNGCIIKSTFFIQEKAGKVHITEKPMVDN